MIAGLERFIQRWGIQTDASVKPGLQAIEEALAELGEPHKSGRFVHIAGSNGKGSTAAFLSAILQEHGLTVGTFFSPAIEDVLDQIQLNGNPISEEEMNEIMAQLAAVRTKLTEFELLTAAAFLAFNRLKPDVAIVEAGMGGRFDSTNVINPDVAIIPSISLEHTNFLGGTIEQVADHKAGIIKEGVPLVTGWLLADAEKVIRRTAEEMKAPVLTPSSPYEGELKLKGKHQRKNAALALCAAESLLVASFDRQKAETGVMKAFIANRFEEVLPGIIFDGAHNPDSVQQLVETVREEYPGYKVKVVLGILKDKEYELVLRKLETISDDFAFLNFDNPRALSGRKLFEKSRANSKTIQNRYAILPVMVKNEVTIVTGSLYLLQELRKNIKI